MSYEDQICPECRYAYVPEAPDVCGNPCCLANPSLSDEFRQKLRDMAAKAEATRVERERRLRAYRQSFLPRG